LSTSFLRVVQLLCVRQNRRNCPFWQTINVGSQKAAAVWHQAHGLERRTADFFRGVSSLRRVGCAATPLVVPRNFPWRHLQVLAHERGKLTLGSGGALCVIASTNEAGESFCATQRVDRKRSLVEREGHVGARRGQMTTSVYTPISGSLLKKNYFGKGPARQSCKVRWTALVLHVTGTLRGERGSLGRPQ
jgi:hypothetical protein